MSDHEPPFSGRLIVHTSYGDIQIDLWCRESPKICHDLIQLALEGSFDGSLIEQVKPEVRFAPIHPLPPPPYEYHPRLKYHRRGLVGYDMQRNEFFIAMAATPQFDRTYTLLGQVVGDTIFNVLRMTELELDERGRVRYPPRIDQVEIVSHPFDDIVPRAIKKEVRVSTVPAVKRNTKLLSFAQSDDEEDEVSVHVQSSHDVLNDPHLSKQSATVKVPALPTAILPEEPVDRIADLKAQQKALRAELIESSVSSLERKDNLPKKRPASVSALSRLLDGYKQPKKSSEVETLIKLDQFRKKLAQSQDPLQLAKLPKPEPALRLDLCKLHGLANCGSCRDTFAPQEDLGDEEGWLMHRLVFDKEAGYREWRQDLDNLVVIDPRERARQILSNKK